VIYIEYRFTLENFVLCSVLRSEPGSSVSIVSGYGLDDRAIEVDPRQRRKDLSSNSVYRLWLWGPPSLMYRGTGGPVPWAKARPGRDADHSPPTSAEVENE
jgi:hypothetical protein